MVDEAKESTYVKNPLDLDTINENKTSSESATEPSAESASNEPSAPEGSPNHEWKIDYNNNWKQLVKKKWNQSSHMQLRFITQKWPFLRDLETSVQKYWY